MELDRVITAAGTDLIASTAQRRADGGLVVLPT
jgi:hypothetical protein